MKMMGEAMEDIENGIIQIGRLRLKAVRFTDVQEMATGTEKRLQRIIYRLHETAK